jgi:hypothetical protein
MASRFLLRIIDRATNEVVEFEPGLAAEKVFVEDCVKQIVKQGVGFFKSEAHVAAAIEAGIQQAILELKAQIKQP